MAGKRFLSDLQMFEHAPLDPGRGDIKVFRLRHNQKEILPTPVHVVSTMGSSYGYNLRMSGLWCRAQSAAL